MCECSGAGGEVTLILSIPPPQHLSIASAASGVTDGNGYTSGMVRLSKVGSVGLLRYLSNNVGV